VIRTYEDGLLSVLYSEQEAMKLKEILDRPGRIKHPGNSKLVCNFDRILFDIGKYAGESVI
jgi:hypothetical protein